LLASLWQNPLNELDVDNDGNVNPGDVLVIVNHLNQDGGGPLEVSDAVFMYVDTDGDRNASPHDALRVVNAINEQVGTQDSESRVPIPTDIDRGSPILDPNLVDEIFALKSGSKGVSPALLSKPVNVTATGTGSAGAVLVATCDSSEASRNQANYVGDCQGDQEEINIAIQSLAETGGIVELAEGTYDIRAVAGTTGGVTIDKSNVVLRGRGTSTRLLLADDQNINVIRIIGDGISTVTVRELYINGNWKHNYCPTFECSGIFAQTTGATPLHSITVTEAFVEDSARLNILLDGENSRITNNRLGDAGSDSAEILTGPGVISGNYLEIDETTGYGLSTDQANGVTITGNSIWILPTGSVVQSVIRTWSGRSRHIIANNHVYAQGEINRMLEVNGYINVITDNLFADYNYFKRLSPLIVNGASLVHDNMILGGRLVLNFDAPWASSVKDNMLFASTIEQVNPSELSLANIQDNTVVTL
jgi:hypothetical protein